MNSSEGTTNDSNTPYVWDVSFRYVPSPHEISHITADGRRPGADSGVTGAVLSILYPLIPASKEWEALRQLGQLINTTTEPSDYAALEMFAAEVKGFKKEVEVLSSTTSGYLRATLDRNCEVWDLIDVSPWMAWMAARENWDAHNPRRTGLNYKLHAYYDSCVMLLMSPWEMGIGFRSWSEHEAFLKPFIELSKSFSDRIPALSELPYTEEMYTSLHSVFRNGSVQSSVS